MKRAILLLTAVTSAACAPQDSPFGSGPVPTPVLFAHGTISTEAREYGITFSPDGAEAYFTRRGGGRRGRPRIFVSRFVDGAWSEADPVPFSTDWEESPFLTPDGRRMFFSSRRPIAGRGAALGDNNLWVVERSGQGWGEPEPIRGEVNKPRVGGRGAPARGEAGPILLGDGSLLYWTTEDPDWGADLYVADGEDGAFVDPRPLHVDSPGPDTNPTLSPDGRFLIFQSYRDFDTFGGDELYASERTDYGWSEPRLLPEPINSPYDDGYPSFSPDGRYFFFASDRHAPEGYWSIYYVETEALGLDSR